MSTALETIKKCPLFGPLPDEALQALLDCAEERTYRHDDVLFMQTAEEDEVYLVTGGAVNIEISLGNQDDSYEIVSLGPGEIMGEMCILQPASRSATATAEGEVTVLVWKGPAIREVCEENYQVGYLLMTGLAKLLWARLIKWNDRVIDGISWGMDF